MKTSKSHPALRLLGWDPRHASTAFSASTNVFVAVLALLGVVVLVAYVLTLDGSGSRSLGQSPRAALICTSIFLLIGPAVVLQGQRRIDALGRVLDRSERDGSESWPVRHVLLVAGLGTATSVVAWLPIRALDMAGAFPMNGPWAVVAYCIASAAVVFLCAHGIFTAYQFLRTSHGFADRRGTVLLDLSDAALERSFRRCHEYVSWAFSLVGALQLPVLLLFRPALPTGATVVAMVFVVILFSVGPLLFWIPRHWQRARLQEEAAELVRTVAVGGPPTALDHLPAYDFWMRRLRTTGLSLTLPAVTFAVLTKTEDLRVLMDAIQRLTGP